MDLLNNPAIIGLIVGVPAFVLGILGYVRSRKVDEIAEQSGAASQDVAQVGQVIDGLNKLVVNLQSDNAALRLDILDLRSKVKVLTEGLEALKKTGGCMMREKEDGMTTTTIDTVAGPMVIDEDELQIGRFLDADGNVPTHDAMLSFMRKYISEGDAVIDVGANAGFFSLAMAEMVGPTGRVTSMEPNIDVARNLQQSKTDRGLAQIEMFIAAAGKDRSWATLRHDPRGPGGTQVIPAGPGDGYILIVSLDGLMTGVKRPIAFIKIDAEGMDVDVLRGAEDILEKDRPVVVFEWNPEKMESLQKSARNEQDTLWKLEDAYQYRCYDPTTGTPVVEGLPLRPGDYALIPREKTT